MLLKEKLEDQAIKTTELDRTVAMKKLELMVGLQQKLAGVGRTDATVEAAVATLRDLVAANQPKSNKRPAALAVLR